MLAVAHDVISGPKCNQQEVGGGKTRLKMFPCVVSTNRSIGSTEPARH